MRDEYGREIDYMRISITDRCNLRCSYCMPEDIALVPMGEILTYEEIERVSRAAAQLGIRKLKITGGEPLTRRGCSKLIGRLKQIPGIEQVTLTTNGVLLGTYLEELLEHGLDAVNVSLDTLRADRYEEITRRPELLKVLEGIDQAVDLGLKVKVNAVLQRGRNEEEWKDLADLAKDRKLDVRFIEMMPIGYGKDYQTIDNEEIIEKLKKEYSCLKIDERPHGNGPAVYYRIPGFQGSVGFISAIHGKFCGSCNRIRLTSLGILKPCLCYAKGYDIRSVLRKEQKEPEEEEEQLKRVLEEVILAKPKGHCFEEKDKISEDHQMVQIGG